ncbi:endonuclease/exonuclease/phosphatase family protein [Jannaschia donghaensis]|uniref:Endonuclease/Exonuclease/phosphatase family protein n=1 Tax=Jannaschia donghaensis TaxID=420998 RepID=A0A0M6YD96_9RHOB|nr:endonuclease/exonuclease/phosphatase family protein [Jannaschia donghaensis]CTQ48332.1 Endonuclease/Exonuclease/phosphatase family protein [Jannaschia donghaensis]
MRVVNWNIEWMNRWFRGNASPSWGTFDPDRGSGLTSDDAREAAGRVARVVATLSPDVLCLQEGPSAVEEMQLFLDDVVTPATGAQWQMIQGTDGGAQKLYVLRREGGRCAAIQRADDPETLALADIWDADVNGDMLLEGYDFTRLPLVVDADPVGAAPVRIVVLHTKSKYVQFGQSKWEDPARRQEFVVQALEARRRISAEGFRLRGYLDTLVQADGDARIVVTGDFNDGPGRDLFERSYLTHNVADIVLGSTFYPELIFHHPLIARVPAPQLFTARFDDFVDGVLDRPLLLDHFAVSPALRSHVEDAGIGHDAFEAEVENDGEPRAKRPSDHRPIWLDLGAPLSG